MSIQQVCLVIVLTPLVGSAIAGFFRNQIGRVGAHTVTILGVAISLACSIFLAWGLFSGSIPNSNSLVYHWASGGALIPYEFNIGFLIDPLSVVMLVIVNFVSLLVHVYSIGYMADDDGYQRFFSYISLFTFMMLMLVSANNFLQLFFGWEGVGLVSYLLIGFWYQKESAIEGSLKAFLVNRVGDFGFVLGIGLIFAYAGSLDYEKVFTSANYLASQNIELFSGYSWSLITVICLLLFVGAMGKSAQVPLHVWLPESMEGPTPISALIHAATMVTAGVFMIARISPLIELSTAALSTVLVIGATGALFTGILALVMNDIKRVVAYSTLSQLGYMMVAMGASAYSAGMFHLLTHACFKALLFLGAGSVIIGMHHEQDMRKMGGLWNKMPITYVTYVIGSLALCAFPPFAGFYSKDTIIEAAQLSQIPGSSYAYFCVTAGAMVTALYTFRSLFMTFHGKPRMDEHTLSHLHESPWVVWLPLVLLAIPSIILGYVLYMPILFDTPSLLGSSIFVLPEHNVLAELAHEVSSPFASAVHAIYSLPFWITVLGAVIAWICYIAVPSIPGYLARYFSIVYSILLNKYGFDRFNELFFVKGARGLGIAFYKIGDQKLIDGAVVNGSGRLVRWFSGKGRKIQSGYIYHYATVMVFGLLAFLCWLILD
ncbi:TPA: NADH-quinone oxidoreductase subunit L [Legionella pneumophila subsp. pneumophila]|uniref:NADH-quinone oxidoreductase chain L n=1 Tax=Legionella pneumophila (strain Lens) TaxID=297245 RepID=Q5WT31_LEGPL|nr:NADH-quinone oxidoreductase subunit L [Legionella pneumophila]AOW53475.1 NADH-quinone oxidoreductase subunit L [Legionella pneumophila subsp. pneumophila]AOW55628.1 NADH-quinone oxidoreductase subunit L [Legionella pneumophila subsp. pneumophila]AOW58811.1 NADH-quinone oxidoreductase subunit L [Legionella pneumophila subsp. pneumophila]AOW61001.1 NADH-quinone oxidoreductase subunit L [Legionella pneumophila subsp. pneumophila]AOW64274.1 NADH-quinone oxidoreductase subunit L [Legionella pneu